MLLSWGDYGSYSQFWKQNFQQLGILHLLVISGSQMNLVINTQSKVFLFLTKIHFLRSIRFFLPIFVFFCSFYYLKINQFSAPLYRAFIFFWTHSFMKIFAKDEYSAVLAFLLHIFLAPQQLFSLSFALSWISFSFLLFLERFRFSHWKSTLYSSLLSQIVVILLTREVSFGFWGTIRLLIANVLIAYIFDKYLSFILAFLLSTSFLLLILPNIVSVGLLAVLKSLFPIVGKGVMILIHLARNALLWV